MSKKNKDVAGYQILCILSEIDGDFDPREGTVVVDYIKEQFPLGGNLDEAVEELSMMSAEDYENKLEDLAADFYSDSTPDERMKFLHFAMDLINADESVQEQEDRLISRLFDLWDIR
jgi:uncharacterized tellurite resistance protein B-like protein